MVEEAAVGVEPEAEAGERRERSTISFPYGDLDEGITVARAIHDHVGAGTADLDQVAGWMNQTVTSGAFRTKVNSARVFGLVQTGRGKLQLTPLGLRIVSPETEAQARADAFLMVPLYKSIFEKYKGFTLPPSVGLEREMAEMGVAEKQTDKARQAFQRSATQAGFFREGNNKLVRPGLAPVADDREGERRGDGGGGGGPSDMHPFIKGLVESLPAPGTAWPEQDQEQWVAAAKAIFRLIYKPTGSSGMVSLPIGGSESERLEDLDFSSTSAPSEP